MKSKVDNYRLTASIHTFSVKSGQEPAISAQIGADIAGTSRLQKSNKWITKINPNKINGDIFSYSEFCAASYELFFRMGILDCTYWRTDIRLDSYKDNFKDYYKLNLMLINLFSILFSDRNGQAISHMLTQSKEFSDISTKNQYWEVKYYNKKFQTHDTDPAKSRLEFRSLKSTNEEGHKPHEIKKMWFEKLDMLCEHFEELQKICNRELLFAYREYCHHNKKLTGDQTTGFFSNPVNSMTIFTKKQLRDFLCECGIDKRKVGDRVKYIVEKTDIEFFTKSDLQQYIEKIKKEMANFFDC